MCMSGIRFTTLWIYTILKLFPLPVATAIVSLPYGFTLFSNSTSLLICKFSVSLPYGFTLFSNGLCQLVSALEFHYLMDLHYSQTSGEFEDLTVKFHYLMDLHYSQTQIRRYYMNTAFHYLMDLHYSQTAGTR